VDFWNSLPTFTETVPKLFLKLKLNIQIIADKGYDSTSVIQKILDIELIPAIKMKQTLRVKIKHPLRQLSKENWLKYGKKRCRIESLFGNIKNKANSVFKVKREDIAKKLVITWAILWNFYMILVYVFLFIISVLIFRRIFFDFWNRLSVYINKNFRNKQ
jgi:hypothetical protein